MVRHQYCRFALAIALLALLVIVFSRMSLSASSQTFMVNKLTDTDDGTCDAQDCSLREAIHSARSGATIVFKSGLTGTIILTDTLWITKALTINGPGPKSSAVTIDGGDKYAVFDVMGVEYPGAALNLSNLTVTHGNRPIGGGLTTVRGTVTVTNCTFANNHANIGGAIANYTGTLMIENSTFQANSVNAVGAIANYNGGMIDITNSTFFDNDVPIANASGLIRITNSTFQANHHWTLYNMGDPIKPGNATIFLKNTIISNTSDGKNCEGHMTDSGNNVQFPSAACGQSIPTLDPHLEPLQDNGGPTLTIGLEPNSPAIDAFECPNGPLVDQRGAPRPVNGRGNGTAHCDIGAFEYGSNPPH